MAKAKKSRRDRTFRKSSGCGCTRRKRGCSPKVASSVCHGGGYHPSARLRITGKCLERGWLRALDVDDVEL